MRPLSPLNNGHVLSSYQTWSLLSLFGIGVDFHFNKFQSLKKIKKWKVYDDNNDQEDVQRNGQRSFKQKFFTPDFGLSELKCIHHKKRGIHQNICSQVSFDCYRKNKVMAISSCCNPPTPPIIPENSHDIISISIQSGIFKGPCLTMHWILYYFCR